MTLRNYMICNDSVPDLPENHLTGTIMGRLMIFSICRLVSVLIVTFIVPGMIRVRHQQIFTAIQVGACKERTFPNDINLFLEGKKCHNTPFPLREFS
jgi:hypothetical protein